MRKRSSCCCPVSVCPAVCLSVTLMYCIQNAEDVVILLSRLGSPIILPFDSIRRYPTARGTPSAGMQKHGVGKFCDCQLKSSFISEKVWDRAWLMWNINRIVADRSVSVPMTLSDPRTRVSRSLYGYKSNISKTVRLRDKFTIEL